MQMFSDPKSPNLPSKKDGIAYSAFGGRVSNFLVEAIFPG
jgi:hypothetical protein